MKNSQLTIVAATLVIALTNTSMAAAQQYPWRHDVPVAKNTGQPAVRVAFRQEQDGIQSQLGDAQSSVSDVLVEPKKSAVVPADPVQPAVPKLPTPSAPNTQSMPATVESVPEPVSVYQPETVIAPTSQVTVQPVGNSLIADNSIDSAPNYCEGPSKRSWCNLGCERKLFGQGCNGLEVGGWLSGGYHNRNNPLVNNRKNEANLHQLWLFADKQARRDSGWNLGYRADALYGIDAQDLQSFGNAPTGAPSGWDNSWDNGSYGWALPQAYVQIANQDWDVKAGKFFSPFGYEVIAATGNFFYSHSFTSYNTEPFTMTGVLGERTVADGRSYLIGATAGWDTGFDSNSGGNLIFGRRLQLNEFVNLASTVSVGDTGFRGVGLMASNVAQVQLTNDVQYVLQVDTLNLDDNQEFGIVQYLFRDVTECLALGARLEWWKSDLPFGGPTRSTYDFTMGANYRVNSNFTLRPELRFDWGALAVSPGQPIIGFDGVLTF